jgi:putative ABC transport system ATP-binding protein
MINLWKLTGNIRTKAPFLDNLREMVYPENAFIKLILINSVAISILTLVIPVSVQAIINNLGILNVTQPIILMSIVLFIILIFSGGIQIIQFQAIEILRRRLFIRYGSTILLHSTKYLEKSFQSINKNQLSKRFSDVLLAQSSMIIFFVDGIGFIVQYIISMLLLCMYHPYFLIFGVIITALIIFSWIIFGPKGVEAGTPEADSRYLAMGWVDEVLRARPLFMSDSGRKFAERNFVHYLSNWSIARGNLFNQQFAQAASIQFINAFVYAALLGGGYLLVKNGQLSVGQLVSAFIVVTMILSSLPRLQNFYISIYDFSTNLDKLAEFWSHPFENHTSSNKLPIGPLSLKFKEAEFHENVKIDLNILPGEKIYAYVGSFAAARTLAKVVEGFAEPNHGEFYVGGLRFDDVNFSHLRERVMIIGVGRLFAGSIYDNIIGLNNVQTSITAIENALEKVGLLEKIKELPNGIYSEILPNGYPLSISESLALQAARALVCQPSIVIVSSDFDKMSHLKRKAVKELFLSKDYPWTVLFLSQRVVKGNFDRYLILGRQASTPLKDVSEVMVEVEKYE